MTQKQRLATQREEEEIMLSLLSPFSDAVTKKAIVEALSGHEWHDVRLKTIYEAVSEIIGAGIEVDWIRVMHNLQGNRLLIRSGGFWYVLDLCVRAKQNAEGGKEGGAM